MKVFNGRIYNYHGTAVRAICKADNGMRVVQSAEKLNGFAHDADLANADKATVNAYVDKVRSLRLVKHKWITDVYNY